MASASARVRKADNSSTTMSKNDSISSVGLLCFSVAADLFIVSFDSAASTAGSVESSSFDGVIDSSVKGFRSCLVDISYIREWLDRVCCDNAPRKGAIAGRAREPSRFRLATRQRRWPRRAQAACRGELDCPSGKDQIHVRRDALQNVSMARNQSRGCRCRARRLQIFSKVIDSLLGVSGKIHHSCLVCVTIFICIFPSSSSSQQQHSSALRNRSVALRLTNIFKGELIVRIGFDLCANINHDGGRDNRFTSMGSIVSWPLMKWTGESTCVPKCSGARNAPAAYPSRS